MKTIIFCRVLSGYGSLGLILLIHNLLGSHCRIADTYDLPVTVLRQESGRLHQRLGMGINGADIGKFGSLKSHQCIFDSDNLLPHNIIIKFYQQIIHLAYDTGRGILDRQNCKIRHSLLDRHHGVPPGVHVKTADSFAKEGFHGPLAVRSVRSLEYHPCMVKSHVFHLGKR